MSLAEKARAYKPKTITWIDCLNDSQRKELVETWKRKDELGLSARWIYLAASDEYGLTCSLTSFKERLYELAKTSNGTIQRKAKASKRR